MLFEGSFDFAALALIAFLVASAAGALGMTRAAIMTFAVAFVATATSFALEQPAGSNMAGLKNDIDPASITFTSSAELSTNVASAD